MIPPHLFNADVEIAAAPVDGPRGPVPSVGVKRRAYLEEKAAQIPSPGGSMVGSSARVYIDPMPVTVEGTVTYVGLAGGEEQTRPIVGYEQLRGPGGLGAHTVVYLA